MRIRKSVSKLQTKLLHTVQDIIENAPVDPDNLTNEDTDDLVGIESPARNENDLNNDYEDKIATSAERHLADEDPNTA